MLEARVETVPPTGMQKLVLYLLFFLSGFAALVYQVLWMKELKLLFGNTAHAASVTLAVFFLGLAVGGWVGGRWAARSMKPLQLYAVAEAGIVASAGLYFLLLGLYQQLYSVFFGTLLDAPALSLLVKGLLAVGLLFPAAFFLGTTLPLMGQVVVGDNRSLGRIGTWLYSVNTLGAACGAFAAGFYLPAWIGFSRSYLLAMGVNLVVAGAAWALARGLPKPGKAVALAPAFSQVDRWEFGPAALYGLAFISGALALALEVLWTRMFTQVFHNSVYSFSAILVVFLIALALGSLLAHFLARYSGGIHWLALILAAAGVLAALAPLAFFWKTQALRYIGSDSGWSRYVAELFRTVSLAILAPGVAVGAVFPYLFKLAERLPVVPGLTLGRLAAWNTLGAIVGALLAGFLMLETLGLWKSLQLIAALYLLAAALVSDTTKSAVRWCRWMPAAMVVLVVLQLAAYFQGHLTLPMTRVRSAFGEVLVEEWEGSQGVVSVIERGRRRNQPGTLVMRLNNHYTLGSSNSLQFERGQADLPMLIHSGPESVFFLGMGTGVTAAQALQYPIQKLVVTELVPEVVEASRKYFRPYLGSLYEDGRVRLVTEDGRAYLQATSERFDVVVSDLFLPWAAGTSSLYSREHFQIVRSRLNPGGVFAQWLPLYQLSEREFSIIVRTLLEVFPQVTLWRGDFFASRPIVALVGQDDGAVLNPRSLTRVADANASGSDPEPGQVLPFLLYASNLSALKERFLDSPLNTDDQPLIEYLAPRTHRSGLKNRWLTSFKLAELYRQLHEVLPPHQDPYLRELSDVQREYVEAGYYLYQGAVLFYNNRRTSAQEFFSEFRKRVPLTVEQLPNSLAREPADDQP